MFGEKENNGESELPELSEDYNIQTEFSANVSVFMRSVMGDLTSPCFSSVLDPQDQYVVGSYSSGEIKVYDPHGGGLLKNLRGNTESSGMPITSVLKFKPLAYSGESQSETLILAGDNGGNITKFDVIGGNIVDCIQWTGENENKINALDYSSDGSQFAAAGYDKIVRIYDDNTMQ
jgi:WD40 repeat protein